MGAGDEPPHADDGVRGELRIAGRATAEVFRNPDLRRAQLVLAAFTFLDLATWLALLAYAYVQGGSASVGIVSIAILIPAALAAPLGAVLGDRGHRVRVLLLTFLTEAVLCGVVGALMFVEATPTVVYATAVLVGVVLTLVRPLHGSLVPWLVRRPEELTAAYASAGLLESVGIFIGPAVAGVLLALGARVDVSGPGIVFSVSAFLMFAAAALVARIHPPAAEHEALRTERGARAFVEEATGGLATVWHDRRPRLLIMLLGMLTLMFGLLETLTVVLAFEVLNTGQAGVGFLNMAFGVGTVVGGAVAILLAARSFLSPALRKGIYLAGAPVASMSLLTAPFLIPPLLGLSGVGGAITDVAGRTMLQRLVPADKLTRAFGVLESLYLATEGIGGFLGAMLITGLGLRPAVLIAGLLLPVAAGLAHRRISQLDVGVRVPAEEMALLRRTIVFAPLQRPSLERVARNLVPLKVPAGTVIIRQGDVGDRFYVIADGGADVLVDGVRVHTLRAGQYFGEVALLHDVLRTATVQAATDLSLFSLERDVFVEAVSGSPASRAAALTEAERRHRAALDVVPQGRGGEPVSS